MLTILVRIFTGNSDSPDSAGPFAKRAEERLRTAYPATRVTVEVLHTTFDKLTEVGGRGGGSGSWVWVDGVDDSLDAISVSGLVQYIWDRQEWRLYYDVAGNPHERCEA